MGSVARSGRENPSNEEIQFFTMPNNKTAGGTAMSSYKTLRTQYEFAMELYQHEDNLN